MNTRKVRIQKRKTEGGAMWYVTAKTRGIAGVVSLGKYGTLLKAQRIKDNYLSNYDYA